MVSDVSFLCVLFLFSEPSALVDGPVLRCTYTTCTVLLIFVVYVLIMCQKVPAPPCLEPFCAMPFFSLLIYVRDAGRDTREGFVGSLRSAISGEGWANAVSASNRMRSHGFFSFQFEAWEYLGVAPRTGNCLAAQKNNKKNEESIGRRFGVSFEVG